jgi:hypothetical protein
MFSILAPLLDVDINLSGSDTDQKVPYGSDAVYDLTILTIPRSPIILEISRNGILLSDDVRFESSVM